MVVSRRGLAAPLPICAIFRRSKADDGGLKTRAGSSTADLRDLPSLQGQLSHVLKCPLLKMAHVGRQSIPQVPLPH